MHSDNLVNRQNVITRRAFLARGAGAGFMLTAMPTWALRPALADTEEAAELLEEGFRVPPDAARPWTYWWWLDGAVSKEGISRDLEEMKEKGIAGALIFDAGLGGQDSPKGPAFMSEEWRDHFRYALQEAARLDMEIGVNLCSGWDAGGAWVEREDAIKSFVWSETQIEGPVNFSGSLKEPQLRHLEESHSYTGEPQDWYRDISVWACPVEQDGLWDMKKAIDLSTSLVEGRLNWSVPEGKWTILRLGYRMSQARVKFGSSEYTSSERLGWEIDPLSAQAMDHHLAHTATLLIQDAGPLTGRTLKYLHIDSWEVGQPTWTRDFVEQFRRRRGYDPMPYLPALAKRKIGAEELMDRFLWDYRRTLGDLVAENYYGRLTTFAHKHGLGTHCEAGGPFFDQDIDALECLATDDVPMGEFWSNESVAPGDTPDPKWDGVPAPFFQSTLWRSTSQDGNYGCVRQAASCAHTYGKALSQAEAYTNFNDDWVEYPAFLKPFGDRAFCLGLSRQVLCFYVHQPDLNAVPGYQWEHVGTHFDRNITWWNKSHAWLTYIARCQYMLQKGLFGADILYFCGETVPNFALIDRRPISGFDYDVINAQALLSRTDVRDGQIILPDGMSYRYLVIPEGIGMTMSTAVLQKLSGLVELGATLVGLPPKRTPGLNDFAHNDEELKKLADSLWGTERIASGTRRVGKGRVIWGTDLQTVIQTDELPPAFEMRVSQEEARIDWTHRRVGDADIFFLVNESEKQCQGEAAFRVAHKIPELWNPVTGDIRELPSYSKNGHQTVVPVRLEAYQSYFVVFRKETVAGKGTRQKNFPDYIEVTALGGPWDVAFDPAWGGPSAIRFAQLDDWSKRPEEGIRFYSGTATYKMIFDLPGQAHGKLCIDLGVVKYVAQIRLNGKDLGVVWTDPWRVGVDGALRERGNELEIEVVNLWPNRLIGDGKLPKEKRRTVTNVRTYDAVLPENPGSSWCMPCAERKQTGKPPELLPSGLLGPVRILREV